MKISINKLIENDIINYGMSKTSGFDYSVYLDSYIDDFDDKSKQYILDYLEDICKDISANENLSSLLIIKIVRNLIWFFIGIIYFMQ